MTASQPSSETKDEITVSSKSDETTSPDASIVPGSSATLEQTSTLADYTTLTPRSKLYLTVLLGFTTCTSPLTATIYFPLLPLLRTHFHTSAQAINLSITIYIAFQAISPAIFGPLSDTLGRRPVYILALLLYVVGNLGLALNKHSLAVLLILRAVQSLGASATQPISCGIVADVCPPSERGKMLGYVTVALNLGTCVGPVIGGLVAYTSGSYEWVFWALVIVGFLLLFAVVVWLPETCRYVVANGSDRHPNFWEESLWNLSQRWLHARKGTPNDTKSTPSRGRPLLSRIRIRNPLACLAIIFHRDTFCALWMQASFYVIDYIIVAAMPDIYKDKYHFNELRIGLAYLPRGVGLVAGNIAVAYSMDRNYRHVAKRVGFAVDKRTGDNLFEFPIERARSRGAWLLVVITAANLIGYGWIVDARVQYSVPFISQFVTATVQTYMYTVFNGLLIDIYPESPSTASATASITRCAMAATAVAVLQPIVERTGRGWLFTGLGIFGGVSALLALWAMRHRCMEWRQRRIRRERERAQTRQTTEMTKEVEKGANDDTV